MHTLLMLEIIVEIHETTTITLIHLSITIHFLHYLKNCAVKFKVKLSTEPCPKVFRVNVPLETITDYYHTIKDFNRMQPTWFTFANGNSICSFLH